MYVLRVVDGEQVRYVTHGDKEDPRRTEARTFLFRENARAFASLVQAMSSTTGQVEVEEVRYMGCICGKDFGCKCG